MAPEEPGARGAREPGLASSESAPRLVGGKQLSADSGGQNGQFFDPLKAGHG